MVSFPANFECCHHCLPPKRQPGCHGYCDAYLNLKKKRDEQIREYKLKHIAQGYVNHEILINKNKAAIHRKSMAGIHPHTGNT